MKVYFDSDGNPGGEVPDEDARLLKQFPDDPVDDVPSLDRPPDDLAFLEDNPGQYSDKPPNLQTVALMKTAYATRKAAQARGFELARERGVKVWRFFETARAFVLQVYVPLKPGEGIK